MNDPMPIQWSQEEQEQLKRRYNARRPMLIQIAEAVKTEIEELLLEVGFKSKLSPSVLTATQFAELVSNKTLQNPLTDLTSQLNLRVVCEDADDIEPIRESIETRYHSAQEGWNADGSQVTLKFLIPQQAKPDGCDRKDLPNQMQVSIVSSPSEPRVTIDGEPIPPLALVMKGGGIKGLAYLGALDLLRNEYDFSWFIGTSAGAITSILLAAGYTVEEMKEILEEKNFKDFYDAKWYQQPFNLLFKQGLHPAKTFTDWMDGLLAEKLKQRARVTLGDIQRKTGNRVTVYASQQRKKSLTFDSVERPDVAAAYAARCSMSIPLVFIPETDQGIFAFDGGLQNNFPIRKLIEDHGGIPFVSLFLGAESFEPIEDVSLYLKVLDIVLGQGEDEYVEQYKDQTVVIDPRPIGTLDFSLSSEEKCLLLASGRVGALTFTESGSDRHMAAVDERNKLRKSVDKIRKKRKWIKHLLRAVWFVTATVLGICLVRYALSPDTPKITSEEVDVLEEWVLLVDSFPTFREAIVRRDEFISHYRKLGDDRFGLDKWDDEIMVVRDPGSRNSFLLVIDTFYGRSSEKEVAKEMERMKDLSSAKDSSNVIGRKLSQASPFYYCTREFEANHRKIDESRISPASNAPDDVARHEMKSKRIDVSRTQGCTISSISGALLHPRPKAEGELAIVHGAKWSVVSNRERALLELEGSRVVAISSEKGKPTWIQTNEGSGQLVDGKWQIFTPKSIGMSGRRIHSFATSSGNKVWISTYDEVACSANGDWSVFGLEQMNLQRLVEHTEGSFSPNKVFSMTCTENGVAWVVAASHELTFFENGKWDAIKLERIGLTGSSNGLQCTPDGTVWVCSEKGVASFADHSWTLYATSDLGLKSRQSISSMLATKDNDIWIATDQELARYHKGKWQAVDMESIGFRGKMYRSYPMGPSGDIVSMGCLNVDSSGAIWVHTNEQYLARFKNERWVSFTPTEIGFRNTREWEVKPALDGNIWVYCDGELARYQDDRWEVFKSEAIGVRARSLYPLVTTAGGTSWAYAENTLACLRGTQWASVQAKDIGLPEGPMRCLLSPTSRTLCVWRSSKRGLSISFSDLDD